ncbi:MAG: hypothetical protein ACRD09_14630 [Vicinamibacterales bacterium]
MTKTVSTVLLAGSIGVVAARQLTPPASWRVRSDAPPEKPIYYVEMPPGWHITTGPGSILHDPAYLAEGRFALETEIFLFPGTSQEGYGLFAGGKQLDADPAYVAFLLRRDGSAAIESRAGGKSTPVRGWERHEAVKPGDGREPVANVLRVVAEALEVTFEVNGKPVLTVPRADVSLDGAFGFRAGADVNLHASRLDVTRLLAPPRRR